MSPNNPLILDDEDLFNSSFSLFSPERTSSARNTFADDFNNYLSSSDSDQMYISESSTTNSLNGEAVSSSDSEVDFPIEQPFMTFTQNDAIPCTPNGREVFSYSHNSALAARSLPGAIDGLDSFKDQIRTLWSPVNVSNPKKPKAFKSSTLAKQTKALKSSQLSGRKPRKSGRAVKKHEPYTPGKPSNYRGPSSAI